MELPATDISLVLTETDAIKISIEPLMSSRMDPAMIRRDDRYFEFHFKKRNFNVSSPLQWKKALIKPLHLY
jgi:hypothetical protein